MKGLEIKMSEAIAKNKKIKRKTEMVLASIKMKRILTAAEELKKDVTRR